MAIAVDIRNPDRAHASLVTFDPAARRVTVDWEDGHRSRFPYIWLRHACFFPAMGRPEQSDDAPFLLPELPETLAVDTLRIDGQALEIAWAHDGSTTRHDFSTLRNNCVSGLERASRRPPVTLWDAEMAANFVWFPHSSLDRPESRLAVFEHLLTHGIALLRDCPTDRETLLDIAARFGPVRRTHFGEVFEIRSTPEDKTGTGVGIGATACNSQAPHTDESFRHGQPGISFFHCLKAHPDGGGASVFVDGFAAAEALRRSDPEAFDFLTATPIQFRAERNPVERFRSWKRMIATDHDGIVRGVSVSDRTFAALNLPEEQIERAYRAIRAFSEQFSRPGFKYERLMQPGEMAIFDNHRVLHARHAFDPSAGERHLQQVSVDREEFHSFMRQLAEKRGRPDLVNFDTDSGVFSQR